MAGMGTPNPALAMPGLATNLPRAVAQAAGLAPGLAPGLAATGAAPAGEKPGEAAGAHFFCFFFLGVKPGCLLVFVGCLASFD